MHKFEEVTYMPDSLDFLDSSFQSSAPTLRSTSADLHAADTSFNQRLGLATECDLRKHSQKQSLWGR